MQKHRRTSTPFGVSIAHSSRFCWTARPVTDVDGLPIGSRIGHVSNFWEPTPIVIEPLDAYSLQHVRREPLTHIHAGLPAWTRLELAPLDPSSPWRDRCGTDLLTNGLEYIDCANSHAVPCRAQRM